MNKLSILGGFLSSTSIYLLFFDKIPFAAPWGLLFGLGAIYCAKLVIEDKFHV